MYSITLLFDCYVCRIVEHWHSHALQAKLEQLTDHDSLDAFHVVSLDPLAWRLTVSWCCRHTSCSLPPIGHVHKPAAVFFLVREQLEHVAFVWPQEAASLAGSSGEVRCVSVRCFCPFSLPFELKVPWHSIVTQFFASWVLQRSERR